MGGSSEGGSGSGEFRFGAPFENVRSQAQGEPEQGDHNGRAAGEAMAEDEHERIIWEHFLVLKQVRFESVFASLSRLFSSLLLDSGSHSAYVC